MAPPDTDTDTGQTIMVFAVTLSPTLVTAPLT